MARADGAIRCSTCSTGWGGHRDEWIAYGLINVADRAIRTGDIPPMIIVLPQGDKGYWVDHADDGPRWGEYVTRDLVRHIDATYRTLRYPSARAIGGLSMGGWGASRTLSGTRTSSASSAHTAFRCVRRRRCSTSWARVMSSPAKILCAGACTAGIGASEHLDRHAHRRSLVRPSRVTAWHPGWPRHRTISGRSLPESMAIPIGKNTCWIMCGFTAMRWRVSSGPDSAGTGNANLSANRRSTCAASVKPAVSYSSRRR